jgi:hypothetical protein
MSATIVMTQNAKRHGREHGVVGSRRVDGKADRLSKRERANQARRVSNWGCVNQFETRSLPALTHVLPRI